MDEETGYSWEGAVEKTWEALQEDESGLLKSSVADYVHAAKRRRMLERKSNVRLGIMRHVYIIVDTSQAMNEKDLTPTRQMCALRLLDKFLEEFFDQNPISQLGFLITRDKRAEKIGEMSGNIRKHRDTIKALSEMPCQGEPSLQNSLDLAISLLKNLPSHTSREIVLILGSLTTCDPGNIYSTIEALKSNKIRCSVIGLAAELHVCKAACKETNGSFNVILDETHFKDLLSAQCVPPPVKNLDSKLVRMGFPEHRLSQNNELSICVCHAETEEYRSKATEGGYFCPQCKSKYCTLPVECKICGLTLVLAPHLARSYHHLFPMQPFKEMPVEGTELQCFSCFKQLEHKMYSCDQCQRKFCLDCELFIHESLHLCPGCV